MRMGRGGWRRLHNEKLYSLYCSLNIVKVIKSRILRWAGHLARMKKGRSAFKFLTDTPSGKRLLGWPRCNGRTKLEYILNPYGWI